MRKLTDDIKILIIQRLASFVSAAEIQKELKQDHRLDLSLAVISTYDLSNIAGQRLSAEHQQLFRDIRKRVVENEADVAISHRSYRLIKLQQIVETAKAPRTAMQALEQAAKETGGSYTNRSEVSGPGGKAIQIDDVAFTDERRADRVMALLDAARARRDGPPPAGDK